MTFAIAANVRKAVIGDAYGHPGPSIQRICVPGSLWVRIATQEAFKAGVKPSLVLGTSYQKPVREARWKAWRRILESNPKFSVKSLASVCGYHHTTIATAIQRMKSKASLAPAMLAG